MEMGESARTSLSEYGSPYFESRKAFKKVVVVVDATRELTRNALSFTVKNIVEPGDRLTVLGIMDRINNRMGFKNQADISGFIGTNEKILGQEISNMASLYGRKLQLFSDLCDSKGVFLDIKICAGAHFKSITLQQAIKLQATWIILDRHLKKDKKFYTYHLPCNVILMNEKDEAVFLRDCTGPRSTKERFQKFQFKIILQDIQSTVDFLGAEEVLSGAFSQNGPLDCNNIVNEINCCEHSESQATITSGKHFLSAVASTNSAAEIQEQSLLENCVKRAIGEKRTSFTRLVNLFFVLLLLLFLVPLLRRQYSFLD